MFKKETVDIAKMDVNALSYTESANRMRKLLKTGKYTFLSAIFLAFQKKFFYYFPFIILECGWDFEKFSNVNYININSKYKL